MGLKWRLSDKSVFYDNVLAYFTSLNGIPALYDNEYVSTIKNNHSINLEGKTTGKNNHFNRLALIEQMKSKFSSVQDAVRILSQQLVISCYASVEDENNKSPEFEFFRHLRNGCAHGNKFKFISYKDKKSHKIVNEPSRLAKWNGLEITRSLEKTEIIFAFLAPGDILKLLKDISEKIENIT